MLQLRRRAGDLGTDPTTRSCPNRPALTRAYRARRGSVNTRHTARRGASGGPAQTIAARGLRADPGRSRASARTTRRSRRANARRRGSRCRPRRSPKPAATSRAAATSGRRELGPRGGPAPTRAARGLRAGPERSAVSGRTGSAWTTLSAPARPSRRKRRARPAPTPPHALSESTNTILWCMVHHGSQS